MSHFVGHDTSAPSISAVPNVTISIPRQTLDIHSLKDNVILEPNIGEHHRCGHTTLHETLHLLLLSLKGIHGRTVLITSSAGVIRRITSLGRVESRHAREAHLLTAHERLNFIQAESAPLHFLSDLLLAHSVLVVSHLAFFTEFSTALRQLLSQSLVGGGIPERTLTAGFSKLLSSC